jgi:nickel/cobalt transporter (NicO) family protein
MGRPPAPRRTARRVRRVGRLLWLVLGGAAALAIPATATAHPLGNFTINHYAGLTVAPDHVAVDIVIDKAEIPAFQDRQDADTDGDGSVSDDEAAAWATTACAALAPDLHLVVGGTRLTPVGSGQSISFPPGAGGLSTLRLECPFTAALPTAISGTTTLTFSDTSFAERIGWREIVATADGTMLDTHGLPGTSPSQKLTAYPADMIAQPLDIRSATIGVRPGPISPSAAPVASAAAAPGGVAAAAGSPPVRTVAGAVPGGVAGELPPEITSALSGRTTPLVWIGALAAAFLVGAFHAITPGHGKTVMAAYLVGTRGSPAHAVGLGLSVAISHTMGILVLALIVIGAEGVLPPEIIARTTPVIAAASIVVIGGVMLVGQVRQRRAARHAESVDHGHDHAPGHRHGDDPHPSHEDRREAAGDRHRPSEGHGHSHAADHAADHAHDPGEHRHGGRAHRHAPAPGTTLTWRSLFALGLTGGLIPSVSALVILLASIVAGRAVLGLVLVVVFGAGMASVMTAVGLAMVFARTRLDRVPRSSSLGRFASVVPLIASIAVVGIGLVLTWTAIAGPPAL